MNRLIGTITAIESNDHLSPVDVPAGPRDADVKGVQPGADGLLYSPDHVPVELTEGS